MSKRILIFSTVYLPLIGGAEVAVKEITDRLGGDFSFDLICARIKKALPKEEKIGQVNVYRLGCGCFFDKYCLALLGHFFAAKLHKKNNYNAIWAIMASFGGFAAMFFKKQNPAVPFLLTLQEGDPLGYIERRVGIFKKWFRQIFRRADYIQAISNFLADWAKKMGAKCPIEVVPNGVDLEKFQSSVILSSDGMPASRRQATASRGGKSLKEKLGIKENEKIIITVSRLVKKNGVGDLIEAMQYLPENVKLLIVGDGEERAHLSFVIGNLSLGNKVFLLGSVPPDKVIEYYLVSNIFVRSSLSEGLGNVFLEAMAAGLPIIGTRVGGIPDFLRDGETGLFCEVQNPQSIADKINLLLGDESLRRKLIDNGKSLVAEKYDWNNIAKKMESIFNNLKA